MGKTPPGGCAGAAPGAHGPAGARRFYNIEYIKKGGLPDGTDTTGRAGAGSSCRLDRLCGRQPGRGARFCRACHSTDIAAQYGTAPDLCVYAGVPAAMFLANADPEADLAVMAAARENLRRIAPKELVLISSIAVYADSRGKDEDSPMPTGGLPAYGRNRLQLETWVREDFPRRSSCGCPRCTAGGCAKISCTTCTPSPRPCSSRTNTPRWPRAARLWPGRTARRTTAFTSSTARPTPRRSRRGFPL